MEQHCTINFEGRTLHYRDEGRSNTTTLVFLHGYMQNLDVWSSYVLSYMRDLRVITIDLPGHGLSDTFCEVHTMDFMARAVKEVLVQAGVEQCVMVGHSMGGYVALAFAENNPYMVRGLVLMNSHAMADDEAVRANRLEACRTVEGNRASYIVGFVPTLFSESKRHTLMRDIKELQDQCLTMKKEAILAAQKGMMQRPSRTHVLQRMDVPVLFIYGKDDERIPVEIALSHAMLPRYAELMLLGGVGHMSFLEERDYIKPRLKNFTQACY